MTPWPAEGVFAQLAAGGRELHKLLGLKSLGALACLVAIGWSATARAAENESAVYTGTIGKADVVMEIETFDDSLMRRYFYRKFRMDIPLSGAWKGRDLVLESDVTGDRFILRRTAGGFSGTLTTAANKKASRKVRSIYRAGRGRSARYAAIPLGL